EFFFFFFNDTATTEIYTLSLHDALPIATPWHPPGPTSVAPMPSENFDRALLVLCSPSCLRAFGGAGFSLSIRAQLGHLPPLKMRSLRLSLRLSVSAGNCRPLFSIPPPTPAPVSGIPPLAARSILRNSSPRAVAAAGSPPPALRSPLKCKTSGSSPLPPSSAPRPAPLCRRVATPATRTAGAAPGRSSGMRRTSNRPGWRTENGRRLGVFSFFFVQPGLSADRRQCLPE